MKKKLNEMSNEVLIKNRQTLLASTGVLSGLLLVLFVITLYLSMTKGFNAMISVPFAISPIVVINLKKAAEIKKELLSRGVEV